MKIVRKESQWLMIGVFLTLLLSSAWGQEAFILDCPVTIANPLFDFAGMPELKALVLWERYRFIIFKGSKTAVATTQRNDNLLVEMTESATQYQIFFENKYVVIDRLTAEFQVGFLGGKGFFGSGICKKVGEQKF